MSPVQEAQNIPDAITDPEGRQTTICSDGHLLHLVFSACPQCTRAVAQRLGLAGWTQGFSVSR